MNQQELHQYLEMLADRTRCAAYERAIARAVPGRTVLDLGSGPGFLSHLALKHGAKKVYAIDGDARALQLAGDLARRFPDPQRFVPVHGVSMDVSLPEPVDVIVSETLDSTGIGEKTHISLSDAARRFLVPGGTIIPHRLDLYLGLGQSSESRSFGRAWQEVGHRFGLPYEDFSAQLAGIALATRVDELVTGAPAPAPPGWVPWQSVDLAANDFHSHTVVPMRAQRTGRVDGVAIAWVAHLLDDIVLSTLPDAPETHWKQGFVHLAEPIAAEVNDQFVFEIAFEAIPYQPLSFNWKLHFARSADRPRFLAGLPEAIRPLVETGRVAIINPTR
jgi:SAM-dependent methyltransferase